MSRSELRIALCYSQINDNYTEALVESGKSLGLNVKPVWFSCSEISGAENSGAKNSGAATFGTETFRTNTTKRMMDFSAFCVEDFDGLLIPGGGDIDPCFYGEENHGSIHPDIVTDRCQFAMLDAFVKAKKPILGICRGHQLINIYFGGSLYQDIPEKKDHVRLNGIDNRNIITASEGSVLRSLYGDTFPVNSSHHQAVNSLGKGLRVTARCQDGVIEALEHESLPIITVQFHPERMDYRHRRDDTVAGGSIFEYFLAKVGK